MTTVSILRLYCDPDGESHFKTLQLKTEIQTLGSSLSLSAIAEAIPTTSLTIREVREEGTKPLVWHPNPHRRIEIFPAGLCEIEASDGDVRRFGPGHNLILLGEDVSGKGHLFRPISGPRITLFLDVPDDWQP